MSVQAFDPNSPSFFEDSRHAARATLFELATSTRLAVFAFATSSLRGVPIQAAVLGGPHGDVLHTIRTSQPLDPESQAYHGLTQHEVDAAPSLAATMQALRQLLGEGQDVITFTPDFMRDALVRACRLEGVEMFGTSHWRRGQEILAPLCGRYNWTTNRWSRPKLIECIGDLAVPASFAALGTALGNAQRLKAVLEHHAFAEGSS